MVYTIVRTGILFYLFIYIVTHTHTYNPISLKSNEPFRPANFATNAISILDNGGRTSIKNFVLIYLLANPPKWTSSNLKKEGAYVCILYALLYIYIVQK